MLTNTQAYNGLSKARIFWDRIDFQTIAVFTTGYRTSQCYGVEKYLRQAGMRVAYRTFDRISGNTVTHYVHQLDIEQRIGA